MWKIGKLVSKGDYNYCVVFPSHLKETTTGYVLHHRVVVENALGRLLNPDEVVSRKIQLHGITAEVEAAISGNLVMEFNSNDNPEETETNQDP